MKGPLAWLTLVVLAQVVTAQAKRAPSAEDLLAIQEIAEVQLSPDGTNVVYTLTRLDRAGNLAVTKLWLVPAQGGEPVALTSGAGNDSMPRWSPDGKQIAFASTRGEKPGLWVVEVGTREANRLADWPRSNHFHSKAGEMLSWAPDSRQIAFVAAEPAARAETADPLVITRAQYKTRTAFSDNRTSHVFLVSLADRKVRQLTRGRFDAHSIQWSPRGQEIAFLSNREPEPDLNFNYDLFAVQVADGREERLTRTPGVEFTPVWSADGTALAYAATKRKLTTIDSVAEDSHIWVLERATGAVREVSAALDRRAGSPQWSADGKTVYFLAGDQGKTLVYRVPRAGGSVTSVMDGPFQMGSLSVMSGRMAFTRSDALTPPELYSAAVTGEDVKLLTNYHRDLTAAWKLVRPETLRFPSFDGTTVEGWLMRPADLPPGGKAPLILTIHGGPHGMYGYGFNLLHQVLAGRGFGVLYLNPRGSSGYGQKFADGCIDNWGGGDYQDLMAGLDHALANHAWIDAARLGVTGASYGGFMTNWIITQTPRFKAAVPVASISNLISFYSTSLYQDLIHVEFRGYPWDNYDLLWKYSPLRYVKNVSTPALFLHGEQDNDVHITQAEEMYTALKHRRVEAVLVRYPREGHSFREPLHRLDAMNRITAWFERFLTR
jgi:dipeptidyl aminopeptidase/acylaminoacyl peptidase